MASKAKTSKSGFLRPSTLAGISLGNHDDLPITDSTGSITGLDGGFSETAKLDKIHVPVGSRVIGLIVLEAVSHEYDKVKDGRGANAITLDEFVENTVYKGESVLLIDPDDVEDLVTKHEERIAAARLDAKRQAKAAKGEFELPFADDEIADETDDENNVRFIRPNVPDDEGASATDQEEGE